MTLVTTNLLVVVIDVYIVGCCINFALHFSLFFGIAVQMDFHKCGSACTAVWSGDLHHSLVTVGLYLFKVVLNM